MFTTKTFVRVSLTAGLGGFLSGCSDPTPPPPKPPAPTLDKLADLMPAAMAASANAQDAGNSAVHGMLSRAIRRVQSDLSEQASVDQEAFAGLEQALTFARTVAFYSVPPDNSVLPQKFQQQLTTAVSSAIQSLDGCKVNDGLTSSVDQIAAYCGLSTQEVWPAVIAGEREGMNSCYGSVAGPAAVFAIKYYNPCFTIMRYMHDNDDKLPDLDAMEAVLFPKTAEKELALRQRAVLLRGIAREVAMVQLYGSLIPEVRATIDKIAEPRDYDNESFRLLRPSTAAAATSALKADVFNDLDADGCLDVVDVSGVPTLVSQTESCQQQAVVLSSALLDKMLVKTGVPSQKPWEESLLQAPTQTLRLLPLWESDDAKFPGASWTDFAEAYEKAVVASALLDQVPGVELKAKNPTATDPKSPTGPTDLSAEEIKSQFKTAAQDAIAKWATFNKLFTEFLATKFYEVADRGRNSPWLDLGSNPDL